MQADDKPGLMMFESSQESIKVAQRSGSDTFSASTPQLIFQSNDKASVVYAMLIGTVRCAVDILLCRGCGNVPTDE